MTAPFHPGVLEADPERRSPLLHLLAAGLRAVDPAAAVQRFLRRRGPALEAGGSVVPFDPSRPLVVLAFGKAARGMASGAVEALEGHPVAGLVVTDRPGPTPAGLELLVGGHPVPDEGSVAAADAALTLTSDLGEDDLVLCLVSGGGSALLERPLPGLSLADLVSVTDLLLRAGASIGELNTVRKHLSGVKGGRLGAATAPAHLVTLVLSDVVGSPLEVIASGPTVPDPTTYADALSVLRRRGIVDRVPQEVVRHLGRGAAGDLPETPKSEAELARQVIAVVGDAANAAGGALEEARRLGIPARLVTAELTGEARREASSCVDQARAEGGLLIYAGETTVTVTGEGRGGRNQEAALAAALSMEGDERTVFAALGTDGIDGPTDAAGGLTDGTTVARGRAMGLDAEQHLDRNDSSPYLMAVGDQLRSGPTGTNVGDLWLAWSAA